MKKQKPIEVPIENPFIKYRGNVFCVEDLWYAAEAHAQMKIAIRILRAIEDETEDWP
jgi:hypothetical protein